MQRTPAEIASHIQKVAKAMSKDKPLSARDLAAKTGLDRAIVMYSLDRLHVLRHGDTKAAAYTLEKEGVKKPVDRPDVRAAKAKARKAAKSK